LSSANIGGIAINDAGETMGIVNAVVGSEATILPSAQISSAAKRVLKRQSSVPRPWLGVSGEPIGELSREQILRGGWQPERAMSLFEEHRGILLTSVAPGSPAAVAALRPGDVILRVNDDDIRNADDFSWFLEEAGSGGSVSFTIARPGRVAPEAVMVKLSESPDPLFGLRLPEGHAQPAGPDSLTAQGIETVALKSGVASRFGANGGLLVVYVRPSSAAFNAGLRAGDVIEAIDGQQISLPSEPIKLSSTRGASYSFSVVRNKEKLVLTIVTSSK
jgi:serine protease Do